MPVDSLKFGVIKACARLKNKTEVKSFLQTVQYCQALEPLLMSLCHPDTYPKEHQFQMENTIPKKF